jgi:hypothetical protein
MIELIFAIVVIAISVLSLPMMIQANYKGVESNVKQEAIFVTSAKIMQVLSFPWNSTSVDLSPTTTLNYARVIDRGGAPFHRFNNLGVEDNNSDFRIGHVRQGLHRRFFDFNETITPGTGIDSFNGDTETLGAVGTNSYKYSMQMQTTVTPVNDAVVGNNFVLGIANPGATNLQLIQVTTTIQSGTSDLDGINDQIVLRAYAANIGEIDYNSRSY